MRCVERHLLRLTCAAAVVAAIVIACAPPTPRSNEDDEVRLPDRGEVIEDAPPPKNSTSTKAPTTSSSSSSGSSSSDDAASPDDAGKPETSTPAKLPFGSICTVDTQCAGGLCLRFDDILRCTQACNDDDDCPNKVDCDDDVCEVDD